MYTVRCAHTYSGKGRDGALRAVPLSFFSYLPSLESRLSEMPSVYYWVRYFTQFGGDTNRDFRSGELREVKGAGCCRADLYV